MTNLSWPTAIVLSVLMICTTFLGLFKIVTPDWVTHSLSAVGGFIVGHALGFWRQRKSILNGSPNSNSE